MQTLIILVAIALSIVAALLLGASFLRLVLFLAFEAAPRRSRRLEARGF